MSVRHRISPVDTAWLRMDRPNNLMQIVGVMLFDGELDYERLQRSIERRRRIAMPLQQQREAEP